MPPKAPGPKKKTPKSCRLNLRLTPDQQALLDYLASRYGVGVVTKTTFAASVLVEGLHRLDAATRKRTGRE